MKIVADAYFWRKEGSKVQREEEPATRYLLKLVKRLAKRRHQTRRRVVWWLSEHLEYIGRRAHLDSTGYRQRESLEKV
jgi:hypothetical protein